MIGLGAHKEKKNAKRFHPLRDAPQLCNPLAVTDTSHIIIIGAGLIGLCTADELRERGARVTVVDARSGPCEGTSFSNSGMIHPSQAKSWVPDDNNVRKTKQDVEAELNAARVSVALGERSKSILLKKMKQYGMPVRDSGCLQIQPDLETARAVQSYQNTIGVRTDIVMDPVQSFDRPACSFPDDASGNAQKFGSALAEDLMKRGVEFFYNVGELDARRNEIGYSLAFDGQKLSGDQLVIAAGGGSPALLARLGLRMNLNLVSGAAMDFALPNEIDDLPSRPVMDAVSRTALTVFSDRVRLSGGWGVTNPMEFLERWAEIAPGLMYRLGVPISTWTAQRPISPAGRPYISKTSLPGLWVNTGHGHMGWTLSAGSGELLAQLILEGRNDNRFAFFG